jgi:hypothetical protein
MDTKRDFITVWMETAKNFAGNAGLKLRHAEPVEKGAMVVSTTNFNTATDQVNHPAHYNSGRIEVIEALEDWKLNFHRANAVKYVARAGKKNAEKEIEDLEKAIWYLKRDVELLKASKERRVALRPNDMNVRSS